MISQFSTQNKLAVIALLAVYVTMAFFYYYTPWFADDYSYGWRHYASFTEILQAEYRQYFNWGGRSIAHLYARIILNTDNSVYYLLQPFIFACLSFFPFILGFGKKWKQYFSFGNVLFFFSLLWLTMPSFGQVFLWRIGSANYMLTLFFAMLFLLPYRLLIDDADYVFKKWLQIPFYIIALLAGWSNENLGILICLMAGSAVAYQIYNKRKIPCWTYIGISIALTGWLLLILAPGNYIRLSDVATTPLYQQQIVQPIRFFLFTQAFLCVEYLLCFIFILLLKKKNFPFFKNTGVYIYAYSIIGICAFFFSVEPPPRAFMSTSYLMMAATLTLFGAFSLYYKKFALLITIMLTGLATLSICDSAIIFIESNKITDKRIALYEQSENKDVVVTNYPYSNKYFFLGKEISHDANHWANKSIQRKYKLNSIVASPDYDSIHIESVLYPIPYWSRIGKQLLKLVFSESISEKLPS